MANVGMACAYGYHEMCAARACECCQRHEPSIPDSGIQNERPTVIEEMEAVVEKVVGK
jgi:hypothetical protein